MTMIAKAIAIEIKILPTFEVIYFQQRIRRLLSVEAETKLLLLRHQDLIIDWSVTLTIVDELQFDESTLEVVIGGFNTFNMRIKQNPKKMTNAINNSCRSNLIQRVFQVI